MGRIARVFQDVDMRCQHDGLAALVKRVSGSSLEELSKADFVCFINTKQNRLKIISPGGVLAYYRSPKGRITLDAIQHIPRAFNGSDFKFDRAVQKLLLDRLGKK